jgi:biopolymer transport protein ExbD
MPGYGYIRERRQPTGPSAKPQITSFADITLVLLVIFLVSAAAAVQMVAADLPTAVNTASRDTNLAVTISLSDQPPPVAKKDGAKAAPAPAPAPKEKPDAAKPAKDKKDKKKDPWRFYFEDDTTGIEAKNLWAVLRATKGDSEWPLALIRADKGAPCGHVSILIQCLQGLGVDEIGFVGAIEEQKTEDDKD